MPRGRRTVELKRVVDEEPARAAAVLSTMFRALGAWRKVADSLGVSEPTLIRWRERVAAAGHELPESASGRRREVRAPTKGETTCHACGKKGHNSRTCEAA